MVAECISNNVTNPFTNKIYTKEQLGRFIVGFDIVTIIFLIMFTRILKKTQKEYIDKFNRKTIQMRDFSIRVKGIPHHNFYSDSGGDRKRYDSTIKAVLQMHFEQVVINSLKEETNDNTKVVEI